jgi:hypothetical protein
VVASLLSVTKVNLVEKFLRERAWWRLDSAGPNPVHVARSVVCLLDAAAYLQDVPDDAPDLVALDKAGCFRGGTFDPGPQGAAIVREWQLADESTAGPAELLAELARAALLASPDALSPAAAISIPASAAPQSRAKRSRHRRRPGAGEHE